MVVPSMAFAKSDVDQVFDTFLGQNTPQFMDMSSGSSPSTDCSDSDREAQQKRKPTYIKSLKRPRSSEEKKERRRAQNRQAAATSREKKKRYHKSLENQVETLSSQNQELQLQLQRILEENERLRNQAPRIFPQQTTFSFPPAATETASTKKAKTTTSSQATRNTTTTTTAPEDCPFSLSNTTDAEFSTPPSRSQASSTSVTVESAELFYPQQPEVMAMVLAALSMGFVVQAVLVPIMLIKLNLARLKAFSRRTSSSLSSSSKENQAFRISAPHPTTTSSFLATQKGSVTLDPRPFSLPAPLPASTG